MLSVVVRVLLVVVIACLAATAAYAFSSSQEKEYEAVERLGFSRILSPELQALGPEFAEPDVEEDIRMSTEAATVAANEVADATARAYPDLGYTGGQIASRVSAAPVRTSLILEVRARASSPQLAARLAAAYVEEYISLRRARERRQATAVERVLKPRLDRMNERERATLAGSNLQDRLSDLEVLRRNGSGIPKVVEGARASGTSVKPQTRRNVIFALVLGLVVGIGLVALRSEGRSRARVAAARRAAARGRDDG